MVFIGGMRGLMIADLCVVHMFRWKKKLNDACPLVIKSQIIIRTNAAA